jgi:5'-nucleotidase
MNIPDLPLSEIKGHRLTHLGKRQRGLSVDKSHDPRGRAVYWIGLAGEPMPMKEDTDFYVIEQGYVSLTPLQTDLTSHEALPPLNDWLQRKRGV